MEGEALGPEQQPGRQRQLQPDDGLQAITKRANNMRDPAPLFYQQQLSYLKSATI